MKRWSVLLVTLFILSVSAVGITAQSSAPQGASVTEVALGTAFTYQGHLNDGGSPANGLYDLEFKLYDAASGDSQVGSTVTKDNVTVTDGFITLELDFGSGAFNGEARWLEIGVRPGSSADDYIPLSPRQALTPAPYALYAPAAAGGDFWALLGNAGTDSTTNFLGTTDDQPLLFKTNGTEAMRIDTTGNIGIGTASPGTSQLKVLGTGTGSTIRTGNNGGGAALFASVPAFAPVFFEDTTLRAVNNSTGRAGLFEIINPSNSSPALEARTDSTAANAFGVLGVVSSASSGGASAGVRGINNGTNPPNDELPPPRIGVWGSQNGDGIGVKGDSNSGIGVLGESNSGTGVRGRGRPGVLGVTGSPTDYGVQGVNYATSHTATGVYGSANGTGVFGQATGSLYGSTGVWGESVNGKGVYGKSTNGVGVHGRSHSKGVLGVLEGASSCSGTFGVGGCAFSDVGVLGSSDTGDAILAKTQGGNLFVGQSYGGTNRARINAVGRGFFNGGTQVGGADFAESMHTTNDPATLEPGDVLVIDPENPLAVKLSQEANSQLVAGVYSTNPSVLSIGEHHIDDSLAGEVPVAIVGIVPTKVTAENGPINVGDLLVTSSIPGHAMKAQPLVINGFEIYPTGTILGKALESLASGTGVIKVLVMLR